MFQTQIDKIFEGNSKKGMYPPSPFESYEIMAPLIKKFGKKEADELRNEIIKVERRLKLVCYDFPKVDGKDLNFLRKFVLLLKILNRIIEISFSSKDFAFSWEDIISNLLYLENDPNFMINSMIRELKRRNSYKAKMLNRKDSKYRAVDNFHSIKFKQKKISEYILLD